MRNKIQAPGKQVLHKQVPKAQAIQKEKDPRLVAVGGFGQDGGSLFNYSTKRHKSQYSRTNSKPLQPKAGTPYTVSITT